MSQLAAESRRTQATSLTDLIGNTPLLRLPRFEPTPGVEIYAKLEMQNPVPDLATMNKLASLTGGIVVSPREFEKVLDELRKIPRALEDEVRTVSSLWDPLRVGPLAWLGLNISLAALCGYAIALLLGVEWFLRKRWGLV